MSSSKAIIKVHIIMFIHCVWWLDDILHAPNLGEPLPRSQINYDLWKVTLIGCCVCPSGAFAMRSFALIAPASDSYSTNAIPDLPGTRRTSLNPSNPLNTLDKTSTSASSGTFCKNRILFGGRYSSGITAAAPPVDLRPAPLVLIGRAASGGGTTPAARLRFFCASCASIACFRSVPHC